MTMILDFSVVGGRGVVRTTRTRVILRGVRRTSPSILVLLLVLKPPSQVLSPSNFPVNPSTAAPSSADADIIGPPPVPIPVPILPAAANAAAPAPAART